GKESAAFDEEVEEDEALLVVEGDAEEAEDEIVGEETNECAGPEEIGGGARESEREEDAVPRAALAIGRGEGPAREGEREEAEDSAEGEHEGRGDLERVDPAGGEQLGVLQASDEGGDGAQGVESGEQGAPGARGGQVGAFAGVDQVEEERRQ